MWRLVCAFLVGGGLAGLPAAPRLRGMKRARCWQIGAVACLAAAGLGCSGVQTGDGDLPACDLQTEPLADLDAMPPALGRSPRALLAPLLAGIDGELTRPDGSRTPLRFDATLDEGSAELVSRAESSPPAAVCAASIRLN